MTLSNSMSITPSSPPRPRGKGSNMGQFSVEKPVAPGSVLSGNQQTDTLAVSNGDRQPIVTHIVISRVVKKCLSRWVIPGQFIPVERKNRLSSPSEDRIDSGVLFFEIARLPLDRIRADRSEQARVFTF